MGNILQDFERKMYSTGGDLSLKKTFYYLIVWRWSPDGTARMAAQAEAPGSISLTQGEGKTTQEIKRYDGSEAKRTLGQLIAPDSNMIEELSKWYAAGHCWTTAMTW